MNDCKPPHLQKACVGLFIYNDKILLCLPDFSDRGKRRARKSWIRPQKTVFCDLDSLLKRSTQTGKYTALHFKDKKLHMSQNDEISSLPLHILNK